MAAGKQSVREEAAKVSGFIAQDIDSRFAQVVNPEVVATGMMAKMGAGPGTVSNRPTEDSPELIAARKSGSLERVLRAKRQQVAVKEQTVESGKPGRLKTIYDFSGYDDDEIGLIDPSTLTPDSAEAYGQELDQRSAGLGSHAEAQAWEFEEDENETELEFTPVLPWEQRDANGNLYEEDE